MGLKKVQESNEVDKMLITRSVRFLKYHLMDQDTGETPDWHSPGFWSVVTYILQSSFPVSRLSNIISFRPHICEKVQVQF